MPGGLTGLACEACRAQKKKCDLKKPLCARCERLRIKCEGAGVKRFKFVNSGKPARKEHQATLCISQTTIIPAQLTYSPSNETSRLCQAVIARLRPSHDLRYGMTWAWGQFIEYLPQRLGRNEALDAAVATLLSGHVDVCAKRFARSTDLKGSLLGEPTLRLYCDALGELRGALDDPARCSSAETLCAVVILSTIQYQLAGPVSSWSTAHASGALRLLRLHRFGEGRDDFERQIYLQCRTSVLLNSFVNPAVSLTVQDYSDIEKACTGSSIPARLERHAVRVSRLMAEVRHAINQGQDLNTAMFEIGWLDQSLQQLLLEVQNRLYRFKDSDHDQSCATTIHAYYKRSYGLSLALHAFFLCVRRALFPMDTTIKADAAKLYHEVCKLATEAEQYQPLGALWIVGILMPVWCAIEGECKKRAIEGIMHDFRSTLLGSDGTVPADDLKWMEMRLRFRS